MSGLGGMSQDECEQFGRELHSSEEVGFISEISMFMVLEKTPI